MEKKRLSIGIFVDAFFPMIDGVIIAVDNYAKELSKENDVVVFTTKANVKNYQIDRPYKIVRCHKTKVPFTEYELSLPLIDHEFRRELRKNNFDIIHIHSPFTIGERGVRYAKKKNIPVVSTYHSQYKKDFLSRTKSHALTDVLMLPIMRVFNSCDLAFAVNRKVKEVYKEYGSNVFTIVRNNGTDLLPFEDDKQIQDLKAKYKIKETDRVFLFVGRIDRIKNIFFILDALKILKNKNFKYKMLYVGTGPDFEELKSKIQELNLENDVILTGKITERLEMAKYYKMADLFLFPSLYDASSLVQIEAASQMTPSLFIDGAVTADTIDKDINGYTSENDVLKYADEIIKIFKDEKKYTRVCQNTFKDIYKTWDDVIMETYNDYLSLIEKHKSN